MNIHEKNAEKYKEKAKKRVLKIPFQITLANNNVLKLHLTNHLQYWQQFNFPLLETTRQHLLKKIHFHLLKKLIHHFLRKPIHHLNNIIIIYLWSKLSRQQSVVGVEKDWNIFKTSHFTENPGIVFENKHLHTRECMELLSDNLESINQSCQM